MLEIPLGVDLSNERRLRSMPCLVSPGQGQADLSDTHDLCFMSNTRDRPTPHTQNSDTWLFVL